ncbi:MAG: APC family permease [Pseudomonadota bacterium]|nr:APC family permease [Pseudomonadota bacterium]
MTTKKITTISLAMINIIAVANLRGIPFSAKMGISVISYYGLATILFFIPTALVTSELATAWPNKGGIYVWVKKAFGEFPGFITIWLQWIYNVVWYPTILTFVAANIATLLSPGLEKNNIYTWIVITSLFWLATIVNYLGLRISSMVSTAGALIGTLLPMGIMILLGGYWLYSHPLNISISYQGIAPDLNNLNHLSFFCFIIFGLVGIEMSAVHADEVEEPKRSYPKAILFSSLAIITSLTLTTLAVIFTFNVTELSVTTGIIQTFQKILREYQLLSLLPYITIMIIVGSISSVVTWIIGPTKGLLVAGFDGSLPRWFAKTNRNDVPQNILLLQAIIFTILSFCYIFIPNVDGVYEVLSILTTQLALIVYILLFFSAIRLRKIGNISNSHFRVPGKDWILNTICAIGIFTCSLVIVIGFIPPPDLEFSLTSYALLMLIALVCCIYPAFALYKAK